MKETRVEYLDTGWFIGDFENALHKTTNCEVCYKAFGSDYQATLHHHRKATEITIIIEGMIELDIYDVTFDNKKEKTLTRKTRKIYSKGDIYVIEPFESAYFSVLEPVKLMTIKVPSVPGDKYIDVE